MPNLNPAEIHYEWKYIVWEDDKARSDWERAETCELCKSRIVHVYTYKGKIYGSECLAQVLGVSPSQAERIALKARREAEAAISKEAREVAALQEEFRKFAVDDFREANRRWLEFNTNTPAHLRTIENRITLTDGSKFYTILKGGWREKAIGASTLQVAERPTRQERSSGVEKEAWVQLVTQDGTQQEDQFLQRYFSRFSGLRRAFGPGKIESVISGQRGTEYASLRTIKGKTVITVSPEFWSSDEALQESIFSHEIGHWVFQKIGSRGFVQAAKSQGLDVWAAQPSTMDIPFQVNNFEEAFAETFAVLATKDQRGIGLLQQHWPLWAQVAAECSGGLVSWTGGMEKLTMDWEKTLTEYAVTAFNALRFDGVHPARLSESVAFAVGKQAKRLGVTKDELSKWLQGAYGAVWVRQSNLNPGLDLKEVRKAMFSAYR